MGAWRAFPVQPVYQPASPREAPVDMCSQYLSQSCGMFCLIRSTLTRIHAHTHTQSPTGCMHVCPDACTQACTRVHGYTLVRLLGLARARGIVTPVMLPWPPHAFGEEALPEMLGGEAIGQGIGGGGWALLFMWGPGCYEGRVITLQITFSLLELDLAVGV